MRSYDSPFATRLREIVYTSKHTFKSVAEAIGVSSVAVLKWKDGRSIPGIDNFEKLADHLGVSCDYLLGRSNIKGTLLKDEFMAAVADALDCYERGRNG